MMFGFIGKLDALPGQRDELARILLALPEMPGCRSYVVARKVGDDDELWVTEVGESRDAHAALLSRPVVQDAMRAGKPLIAVMSSRTEVEPLGGFGLAGPDDAPSA
jgi:quinol monooxygenase YgiN